MVWFGVWSGRFVPDGRETLLVRFLDKPAVKKLSVDFFILCQCPVVSLVSHHLFVDWHAQGRVYRRVLVLLNHLARRNWLDRYWASLKNLNRGWGAGVRCKVVSRIFELVRVN